MKLAEPDEALDELDSLPASGLSPGAMYRRLQDRGLGDGLPVGELSPGIVDDMLAIAALNPEHVIVNVPPLRGALTGRRLAVCAALAGCEPEHLPVLVGALSSMVTPELNAYGFLTTTGSAAPLLLINGPARNDLSFNSGTNCLGPGNRSNATVGRCVSLVMRIVGSAREGMADMATMGQPAKYTCCFAENEEASPWEPFSVERGLAVGQSAVTVIGISGTIETFDAEAGRTEEMFAALANTLANSAPVLSWREAHIGGGQPIVVITPEWATQFERAGLTKADVKRELFERATRTIDDHLLHVAAVPDDLLVVVAGGVGIKQTVIPNWNGGSRAVTTPLG
jgi:hypothetical protein